MGSLDPKPTKRLDRLPTLVTSDGAPDNILPPDAIVTLQILPSGRCLTLKVTQPATLGRRVPDAPPTHTDLSEFNALKHGVSRIHCRLERQGNQLFVTDLHSKNGTYINDVRIASTDPFPVADGDRLILGTLHILVFFARMPAP